ncbi:DegT/DnrJ/EryC1/StrS family aminotransferase [Fusobacterium sp. MFO224]|uniref:DegT/DnrJ/EryC1/StrS family aminotransferase n=1 Tax=Fusobacterium sp. MFO224 TaxID=3378070 RepID=UPI0038545935
MKNKQILVTRSSMPTFDEYIDEIEEIWDSHWLTNMGIKHKTLEKELKEYLQVPNITLFTNGHLALECILKAMKLRGEVITTPFTFASTTHAIVRCGLTPVFCDINDTDYTMDVSKIEDLITDRTCAIVPVHVYGNVCDVYEIERIAKKYNLKVIYDAAHTFGEKIDGIGIGNFGDASMFSFHATKVFNTIEGGAVTYKDTCLNKILYDIKNFGITGPETVEYAGGNAKMNEFQAAMGICNLKHVDDEILKRKRVVDKYRKRLEGMDGIKLLSIKTNVQYNYAYFPVVFDGEKYDRDEIFEALKANNVIPRKYFYPLVNDFKCYKEKYSSKDTPVAKYISERVLTLPLYADLELKTVNEICDIILKTKHN